MRQASSHGRARRVPDSRDPRFCRLERGRLAAFVSRMRKPGRNFVRPTREAGSEGLRSRNELRHVVALSHSRAFLASNVPYLRLSRSNPLVHWFRLVISYEVAEVAALADIRLAKTAIHWVRRVLETLDAGGTCLRKHPAGAAKTGQRPSHFPLSDSATYPFYSALTAL